MLNFARTLLTIVALCAIVACTWPTGLQAASSHFNQFEPLYENEAPPQDAHTVGATRQDNGHTSNNNRFAKLLQRTDSQSSGATISSGSQHLLPAVDDEDSIPHANRADPTSSTAPDIGAALGNTAKRQVVLSSGSFDANYLTGSAAAPPPAVPASVSKQAEPPKHWSALDNYYQKLRQSKRLQEQSITPEQIDWLVQGALDDQLLGAKQLVYQPVAYRPADHEASGPYSSARPAYSLPIFNSTDGQFATIGSVIAIQPAPQPKVPQVSYWPAAHYEPVKQTQLVDQVPVEQMQIDQMPPVEQMSWPAARPQYELRKIPEYIQQQQFRMKHQQATFGSWYDQQRHMEQFREEAYCGPRNYINYKVTSKSGSSFLLNKDSLQGLSGASLQELLGSQVPVSLTSGEYPSHMGLYSGSASSGASFVCGATWVSERFALTLATCVGNFSLQSSEAQPTVRAGEWNLNRQSNRTEDGELLAASMVTRRVERVHYFPGYQVGSSEHNLALIEWATPIDFLEVPYICPACQPQLHSWLRTSACWTPMRSVSFSEYVDADGEGDTKLRQTVSMIEVPVKLIANDNNQCLQTTGVPYFNLRYPNYICSANVKTAEWRKKLNQTGHFGAGIYCNEGGNLNLVSILQPISENSLSAYGYLDLSYYRPWMRKVISGRSY